LCLAQCRIAAFLAVLDDALQRAVRHIGIAGLQQQQRGQDAAQPAIAVLEGVDFQEHDDEHADREQRVQASYVADLFQPGEQLLHEARRVERRGCLEHDSDNLAVGVESADAV